MLVLGGGAAILSDLRPRFPEAELIWVATDIRERDHAPQGVAVRTDVAQPLADNERVDLVLLAIPETRALARRWLVLAWAHLAVGGTLLFAGANATGIRSIIADAEALTGPVPHWDDFRQKHRIARFVRTEAEAESPAWASEPGIAPGTWAEVMVPVGDVVLTLATLPGVFAGSALDVGTELLLAHLPIAEGTRVLDVGCGAGAIGFTARQRGAGSVDLTDVNLLAVASVKATISAQGLADVRVRPGDTYTAFPGERYDLIVSNPPFHQGKAVDYHMPQTLIREAPQHLLPDGRLVIVANSFLPYDTLMAERFRHVEVIAETRKFRVLEARNPR